MPLVLLFSIDFINCFYAKYKNVMNMQENKREIEKKKLKKKQNDFKAIIANK